MDWSRIAELLGAAVIVGGIGIAWGVSTTQLADIDKGQEAISAKLDEVAASVTTLQGTAAWSRADIVRLEARIERLEQRRSP
jgi:outer membrane murein-binding lipoprotein Lpp